MREENSKSEIRNPKQIPIVGNWEIAGADLACAGPALKSRGLAWFGFELPSSVFAAWLLILGSLWTAGAIAQETPPSPKELGVRITFLPPPMEGTLSLGIYDKKGKLVRVLAREATEKDFIVGLNGLITHWDGKDDAGMTVAHGTYEIRGYSVGALDVEGVALHGNDWITDDDAPRPVRITGLRVKSANEIEAQLQTLNGTSFDVPIRFDITASPRDPQESAPKIVEGRVELSVGGATKRFPLGDGETVVDAALGAADRLWAIVQTPAGREVRAFTLGGEFLRRLAYAPTDPQPQRILAARGTFAERWSEEIVLLEENEKLQRVRALALPRIPATTEATPPWETVLEKAIWRGGTFEAIKDQMPRADGKPFVPEKEFVVRLINNPLIKDEPTTARVTIGYNDGGSFLQTTDGLPLRRITETPHLRWAVIGREGSGKLLTIFQGDGTVVEEFKVRKLAYMMAFDAGDYEWAGK
jgi:hypothetical protein